ncbi:MAG: BatA domain-containing protein [Deltaproteobacteria bacterium]|nr:BatA domain-containing protein [Deltaproteobacteria bacterium]
MNFSFLNPLFLIGLLAVALPVIAHFISRKSGFKKSFSAVSFLLASQGEIARKSKIKDLFLLLLRSLILVLLVLVFSKPAVFSFSSVDLEGAKSVAIVVDNSYSMGYGDNFKIAKKKAEKLIDSLADGSFGVVFPLVSNDDTKPEIRQDKKKMKEDLKNLKLSYSFADNVRRLEEIFGHLQKASIQKKEVILITDLQKNGWNWENFQREWITTIDITPGVNMGNHAVSGIDFKEQEDSIKIAVRVSNYSNIPVNKLLATVSLGDQQINGFFEIQQGDEAIKEFIFPKEKLSSSEIQGRVETSPDNLKVDDVRYFVLPRTEGLHVLIVDGDPREDARLSETYYLARAVETISEILPLNIVIKDNDAFLDDDLGKYNMIFLANVGDITPQKSQEVEKFLREGGTVIIFTGDRVKSSVYNTLFNILPAELRAVSENNYSLRTNDSNNSLSKTNEKFSQVVVRKFFNLQPFKDSQMIITASDNSPFLINKEIGNGSIFLFASSADTSWNNLPITPVFLPTIKEIFDLTQNTQSNRRNFVVGDALESEFSKLANGAKILTPSGETFKLSKENPKFLKNLVPGIYTVEKSGNSSRKFSLNTDPRESDLKKISLETVSAQADVNNGLVKVFNEIWIYFFWGLIALFISESVYRVLYSK